MDVNVMPWYLAYTLLGNITRRPSDKMLKGCPSRHILESLGVACVVPQPVDKIKVNLDFQIFDVLDLDLLLGSPVYKNFLRHLEGAWMKSLAKPLLPPLPCSQKVLWRSLFLSKTRSRRRCMYLCSNHPSPFLLRL
jgi:hypothetical protein